MRKWIYVYRLLIAFALFGCRAENNQNVPVVTQDNRSAPLSSPDIVNPTPTQLMGADTSSMPATQPNPTPTATIIPVHTAITTIPLEQDVTLVNEIVLVPPYNYLELEKLSIDTELRFIAWEENELGLIYALMRAEVRSPEAKDWDWWRYDLETGKKEPFPPPDSRVTQEIREQLDLCPTEQGTLETQPVCAGHAILLESPTSERIVFSPLSSRGGETWLGSVNGTDLIKLDTIIESASHVQWSPDSRWLLISVHFPGTPGQMTHYLVRADGSFEMEFSALTNHDLFRLNGLFPQFSPNGSSLAYIGSTKYDSFEKDSYHLFLLDLESLESRPVSDRIGMFQWSADGGGLYILDGGYYPMDPHEESAEMREVQLYYIDITKRLDEEKLIASEIPYYPNNSFGTWLWEYFPNTHALAYVGHEPLEFGILLLSPAQTTD